MFIIEDELHCETIGEYHTLQEAKTEIKRLANVPWDQEPNRAPCTSWQTCRRLYDIIEYDDSIIPWNEINRILILSVGSNGVYWYKEFDNLKEIEN